MLEENYMQAYDFTHLVLVCIESVGFMLHVNGIGFGN